MKMFVTATFKTDENKQDIELLCSVVRGAGYEDFCFIRDIERYKKIFSDDHQLMDRAKLELLKCDALLIDVTLGAGGGRAIEAGMAFAHDKPVIVIAQTGTSISVPITGIASTIIEYADIDDVLEPLRRFRSSTTAS